MNPTLKLITLIFISLTILTSCTPRKPEPTATVPQKEYTPKEFTYLWNRANTLNNIDTLKMLYADTVKLYGVSQSGEKCVTAKAKFLRDHPDFKQEVSHYGGDEKHGINEVRCFFIKATTLGGKERNYSAYLDLLKTDEGWKIVTESDVTTDQNIRVLSRTLPADIPKDAIEGDYDGDGKKEYVWVIPPQIDSTGMGCDDGTCECFIKFSNPKIPFIKLESCIGGTLTNQGDINGDGADELGLLPDRFTSCWRSYYVYTLRNKKWINAVDPFSTYCSFWDSTAGFIKKDPTREGYAIIKYSEMGGDFALHQKSVKLH